jgi:hypothetical protein
MKKTLLEIYALFEQYQSNEAFLKARDCNKKDRAVFSEEDLTKKWIESYQIAIKMERREGLQGLSSARETASPVN